MTIKNFAIPLDEKSGQKGDIAFDDLAKAGTSVEFQLTFVTSAQTNILNLITSKGASQTPHPFTPTVANGTASITLTTAQINSVYADASGGNWDYVQLQWTVGTVDAGGTSNGTAIQGGSVYNNYGWPPK